MGYVALTVGGDNILLYIPKSKKMNSLLWNHAGGNLIFQKAGGEIADLNGKDLDFGRGHSLDGNYGRIAAPLGMHAELAKMVEELSVKL